ncbi:MAG: Omp28-related outer membrane protein [Nonlabens sp.]
MKRRFGYLSILIILLCNSCEISSPDGFYDDDDANLNQTLTLVVDEDVVLQTSEVEVTVLDQNNIDVTPSVTLFLNGTEVSGNIVALNNSGFNELSAERGLESSNVVTVEAVEPSYTTKVLIEDYTGAWCGWCPRMSQGISDLSDNPAIVPIAIHNGDSMAFRLESQMADEFGVQGYPTGLLNRSSFWNRVSNDAMDLNEPLVYADKVVGAGLAITSTVNSTMISVDVKVGFDIGMTGGKLIVYALENGIIEEQTNYTNNYGAQDYISDYEHNHILKANLSELFGDMIPETDQERGVEFSKSYNYNAAGVADVAGMEIVAMLVDVNGKVVNVQKADVGTVKDFD